MKQIYNSCEEYLKQQKLIYKSDEQIQKNEYETENEVQTENIVIENNNEIEDENIPKEQISETSKSQMEIDAEYIKQNYNLIIPVNGKITSGFGNREPTEIISAFHQGIDISAVQGTPICASLEGTVIAASYAGDYGNHIKIQNGDVITVYAHCSEINVNVGDYIMQNQVIGKVGATRKSNWSTFAF